METRVEIKYCKNNECFGHKGPNGVHAHTVIFSDEFDKPVESPAFGSRRAGTAMAMFANKPSATNKDKELGALINSAVATADLPETYGDDENFVKSFMPLTDASWNTILLIIEGGAKHKPIYRMIDHNQHTIVLRGCLGCGATIGFYVGEQLVGRAGKVHTMEHGKHVLDQAVELLKISTEDATALREKLPELFKA